MYVPSVSGSGYTPPEETENGLPVDKTSLDMDDFFKLMAAELQNQTMYDTVDNAQYMSQIVQFSMLSQMEELSQSFQSAYALSYIGKNVDVKVAGDDGRYMVVSGKVEQVSFTKNAPSLVINGIEYDPADIISAENG
jgi:flagellar basal-body rod modification protein FlgD